MQDLENVGRTNLVRLKDHVSIEIKLQQKEYYSAGFKPDRM